MAGVRSVDGTDRSTLVSGPFKPYPPSVTKILSRYSLDLIKEMLSGLSDLSMDEKLEALGKKLEEYWLSKAPSVHSSDDEDEEDDEEDDEGDEDDQDDENGQDSEGAKLKSIDDKKEPLCTEEHQVHSECERECKKPRLAECAECHDAEA